MKTTGWYSIAGFTFSVEADTPILEQMCAFEPFKTGAVDSPVIFNAVVSSISTPLPHMYDRAADEVICNDFGRIRMYAVNDGYHFEVSFGRSRLFHTMSVSPDFTVAGITINGGDTYTQNAMSTLLHILFSMAILDKGGIMTHASCVTFDGKGYMFLGKSGTGKSTHASLWVQNLADCTLLNDDNPVIRIVGDTVRVCGTPWSGKTPCYKNESAPLGGIVRLEQADCNQYVNLTETAAFAALLPSCSVIRSNALLTEALYRSAISVCEKINIGLLRCRPDKAAAFLCHDSLC